MGQEEKRQPPPEVIREEILQEALKLVHKTGWTADTLVMATERKGYPSVTHGIFREGPIELVRYFFDSCNRDMLQQLSLIDFSRMTLRERLQTILKTRLQLIGPYIGTWPQAMALLSNPQNLPDSLNRLALLIDEIWAQAGDQSSDISWYAKRAGLSGVYVSTELYMLSDKSEGFADTWKFVDRRLEELIFLEQNTMEVQRMASIATKAALSFLLPKK